MKVSEILNESSELEKLHQELSHEQELYAKIDNPSNDERRKHSEYVSRITAQINKLKRAEQPTSTEPKEDKLAILRQRELDKAEANVKKAQEQLRLAKTDREKKSWKANLEVAKFTLRKAQSQMK